ncbi:MAG: hypothetical protein K6C30_05260 [Bacteroidaceae bacterium]|nr:hypothetical protein [Bacteroidaceae bacterium]
MAEEAASEAASAEAVSEEAASEEVELEDVSDKRRMSFGPLNIPQKKESHKKKIILHFIHNNRRRKRKRKKETSPSSSHNNSWKTRKGNFLPLHPTIMKDNKKRKLSPNPPTSIDITSLQTHYNKKPLQQ